jgi:putative transposase
MPCSHRVSSGGLRYHVINRGYGRAEVFRKEGDFVAFLRILFLACERMPILPGSPVNLRPGFAWTVA